jgi:hypothetical protein
MTRLMLTRLSAIIPRPTQRLIPVSPLYRLRPSPCRRLTTLMRPSQPVRHFWPLRNQRFFCSRFALGALGGAVGDADALDALGFRGRLGDDATVLAISGLVIGFLEPREYEMAVRFQRGHARLAR